MLTQLILSEKSQMFPIMISPGRSVLVSGVPISSGIVF